MIGPALAGTLSAVAGPATPLLVEAGLALAALALIVRIPGLDSPPERADERTLWSIAVRRAAPDRARARSCAA